MPAQPHAPPLRCGKPLRGPGRLAACLVFLSAVWLGAGAPDAAGAGPVDPARAAARERVRRILFNDDGGETRVPPAPIPEPDGFLPVRIAPLAGTHVDTIVFDTTSGTFGRFAHRTAVAEPFLVREGRYRHNILPDQLAKGTDSLRLVIAHARRVGQEVFWTMRMNDTHDASNALLIPRLKELHPDWLMGTKARPPKRGTWSAVDYGRPEIRSLARRIIAEVAANYDVDGIELDFWRHPVFFRCTSEEKPAGDAERALMTELLREVRADLDAAAVRRGGRPILLGVKTPDSVGYCFELGLDLERWLSDGLVDMLVPGGYFQLNQWTESVALARRHGVKLYACLPENRLRDPVAKRERASLEGLRARALAAWAAGVDGIEMFNHFDPHAPFWRELGDPALLRTLPKVYFASVQGAVSSRSYYPAEAHVRVPTLTPDKPEKLEPGRSRTYELLVGDDLRAQPALRARLLVRLAAEGPAPRIHWDDTLVAAVRVDARSWAALLDSARVTPGLHRISVEAPSGGALLLADLLLRIEPIAGASETSALPPRVAIVSLESKALGRALPVAVIAPTGASSTSASPQKTFPVLYFLHGRGRHHRSLLDSPAAREALLAAPFYVVLPQGEDGWYIDAPADPAARYASWLAEVIAWAEKHLPLSRDPARTGIVGWSMGGYGAVRFAQAHPGRFGFVGSIIGLLDYPRPPTLPEGQNYAVAVKRFTDDPAVWERLNPLRQVVSLRGNAVCLVLASRGFERTMNESFIAALAAEGLPAPRVHRLEGGHEFPLVERAVPLVLADAAAHFRQATAP